MSATIPVLWTVGHGSRSLSELLALLRAAGIACVVDVRAHPSSKRHPQFGQDVLRRALEGQGIHYVWEGSDLGGFRQPLAGSPHKALVSAGFRGFADHMGTAGFRSAVERVLTLAAGAATALMCAEREPLQCHRSLIADFLLARGAQVMHLVAPGETRVHVLSPCARIEAGAVIYDGDGQGSLDLQR